MPSQHATERIVRAILRSFVHAGIIPSYNDTAKIEAIPNNYNDAQIDAVLSTIAFGTVTSGTDVISGTGDVNVFVDSDDNDTALGFVRYFRVAQNQAAPPVTVAVNEMLTVGRDIFSMTSQGTTLTVGPRASLGGVHSARVNIGTNGTAPFGSMYAGATLVNGDPGLMIKGFDALGLQAKEIRVYDPTGASVRGGWSDIATTSTFNFGNFVTGDTLAVQAVSSAGPEYEDYVFRTQRSVGSYNKRVIFRSSTDPYATCVIVGGHETEAYSLPGTIGSATFAAIGHTLSNSANVAYVYDRNTTRTADTTVLTVKSATPAAFSNYNLIRCYVEAVPIFRVTSQGVVNCIGSFTAGSGDVAELFPSDRDYVPGTVMVVTAGKCTASTSRAQSAVVGVVSSKPGVEIGQNNVYDTSRVFPLPVMPYTADTQTIEVNGSYTLDMLGTHVWVGRGSFVKITAISESQNVVTLYLEEPVSPGASLEAGIVQADHYVSLAVCGFVPVRCSTEYGDIAGNGDLLVSGPNGYAVLADPVATLTGTILGKAFSPLRAVTDDVVEFGIVNVLVALQ